MADAIIQQIAEAIYKLDPYINEMNHSRPLDWEQAKDFDRDGEGLKTIDALYAARAAYAVIERENARLREALKPFVFGDADIERIIYAGVPDDKPGTITIKMGDIRRARTALAPPAPPASEGE
jgi:hypothetical protein